MLTVELVVGQVEVGVSLGGGGKEESSFSGQTSAYYPLNDGAWHNITLVMDTHQQVSIVCIFHGTKFHVGRLVSGNYLWVWPLYLTCGVDTGHWTAV